MGGEKEVKVQKLALVNRWRTGATSRKAGCKTKALVTTERLTIAERERERETERDRERERDCG